MVIGNVCHSWRFSIVGNDYTSRKEFLVFVGFVYYYIVSCHSLPIGVKVAIEGTVSLVFLGK